jgi:hypothetical protein
MGIRIYRRLPPSEKLPWWVWLGISARWGLFSRRGAIWNAWITTILSPAAIIASLLSDSPQRYFILCFGLGVIPFAVWRWLAIRWLDRRKAWNLARERRVRLR